ncbi:MAG: HAMP domain-containing histidine kinase [Oscillospiraceae bacterium]|nr:HAMP domain-containing histidine kinase [Oscillospiraceae bacterium]
MLTEKKRRKQRRLSHEILALIGLSALISLLLFLLLRGVATAVAESYCFQNDIPMTEFDWMDVDRWIFTVSAALSTLSFSALFLSLLSDRIAYIRTITAGIDQLQRGEQQLELPLEGRNELTELASAINDMSAARLQLQEKEQALAQEKEQFVRSLSHDIRTPLTAILSGAEYLSGQNDISQEDYRAYLQMVQKKGAQMRDLTAILLDGAKRNPEHFDDARLLMEQLAAEFEEALEDRFTVTVDCCRCGAFAAAFDVQELRRIFDNLSSNVEKYADPATPVSLSIAIEGDLLQITQTNRVITPKPQSESYGIGLSSIRRILQQYGGQLSYAEDCGQFSISLTFPL